MHFHGDARPRECKALYTKIDTMHSRGKYILVETILKMKIYSYETPLRIIPRNGDLYCATKRKRFTSDCATWKYRTLCVTLKSTSYALRRIYKIHRYCLASIFVVWKLDIANLCILLYINFERKKFIVCHHKFKLDFGWFLIFSIVASKRDSKYLRDIALINNLKPIIFFFESPCYIQESINLYAAGSRKWSLLK